MGTVAEKAIEPTEGHAAHEAEISIVLAAGFDRELLTARMMMAITIISTVPRMSPVRGCSLVGSLFFISTITGEYLAFYLDTPTARQVVMVVNYIV